MKLSTRGHYGMHAMMDLGFHYGQSVVLLRELCEIHGFSEKYLEQLLRLLRQAGLVESVRGAKGGYWLTRSPSQITTLQIVEALEGELSQLPGGCQSDCVKAERCAMLEVWSSSIELMRHRLSQTTLAELIATQQEMNQKGEALDYNI